LNTFKAAENFLFPNHDNLRFNSKKTTNLTEAIRK
jgi:hypothetical protein